MFVEAVALAFLPRWREKVSRETLRMRAVSLRLPFKMQEAAPPSPVRLRLPPSPVMRERGAPDEPFATFPLAIPVRLWHESGNGVCAPSES